MAWTLVSDTTRDAFLGGRLWLTQPRTGYRAGIDPVLLAAAVPATPGQSVLDLGCGVGAAMLCLGTRVPGLDLWGVERDGPTAGLARENAARNGIPATVHAGDVAALPPEIRARRFHHVIANPPYRAPGTGTPAPDAAREAALGEDVPLDAWIEAASRRLLPKGRLTAIQSAARLPDLLTAVCARLGGVTLRPICPRIGRPASLVIVQGVKESRTPFVCLAPFILHDGCLHLKDGEDYGTIARSVLRGASALNP